ncbi:GNAT family N-acetyltransferase [Cryobacterium psychrophilum]|uniref:N-acetyltransferase n=1 Tax=Cryobacterium psychrophilum TaxID=41988 RepID=A0A4Y8KQ86_9MICO|nr:GNAT family N-acetyltransferase [Cryobacterium psychrophilum]TDW30003.1 putative acetyltransferase [Cryobacterium psychrophilum]TFD75548.1 N-acetyltransferase [Cryobacterium psychrophilum]
MPALIAIEPPRQSDVEALLRLSSEFTLALYPAENNYLLGLAELERAGVCVYVARAEDGTALGIAATVPLEADTLELKRMFVHPAARGLGLASQLLGRIEADAASRGIRELRLETGSRHDAALSFYRRLGYARIAAFGPYVGDELSVCFAKAL